MVQLSQRGTAQRLACGFTLIELCITTTVVGILTAVSVASYRSALLRAQRAEARLGLLGLQAALEREYLNSLRYSLPPDLPRTTPGGRYLLQLAVSADGQHFTARALPTPGTSQTADTACAAFTLTETGRTAATSADCWP